MPITLRCAKTNARLGLFLFGILGALAGCGSDDPPGFEVEDDQIAPSAVLDLRVDSRDDSTLTLLWTSPGDDGEEGRAWRYDVRRSLQLIDDESWSSAEPINGEPVPSPSGRTEVFILLGQGAEPRYYFALRTLDEWRNVSELSNVAEADALDRTPPGRVADLTAVAVGPREVELNWTATGDDGDVGRATGYVLRFAEFPLEDDDFGSGTLVSPTPVPGPSGVRERFRVALEGDGGPTTLWFALQVWDEEGQAGPVSNAARVELSGSQQGRVGWE